VISFVSGYSSQQAEENLESVREFGNETTILIYDETEEFGKDFFENNKVFKEVSNKEVGIKEIKENKAEAFFTYPEGLLEGKSKIQIYRQHKNVIENNNYNATAQALIKQQIMSELTREQRFVYQGELETEVTAYQGGEKQNTNFGRFIVPAFAILVYFLMVVFGMNFLLSSVSEEKESRMMEILLTTISPKSLLVGKLIGLIGVIFTQIGLFALFVFLALKFGESRLPFAIPEIVLDPLQISYAILCIVLGFLILANVMIGVGSAMPTLKEAQSFSSVFMILAMFPLYIVGILISNPEGGIATILSYVPITAPLILLFRNAFNVLPPVEMGISLLVLLIQFILSVFLAVKLFEFGSLEYKEKIDFKSFWKNIRKA
jgi:ABC-2 type transport system permease protein